MKLEEGAAIPEDFATLLTNLGSKRNQLDTTLKVALDHHADKVEMVANDNDQLWYQIFKYFGIDWDNNVERSVWYASKLDGIWVMSKRSKDNPYRLSEESKG